MLWKFLWAALQPGARRLIERGLELRQRGDLRAAERVFREATEKFPRNAIAAVNLALVLLEQHQAASGGLELERALELDPANGPAHFNLANLLRVSGRQDDAIRHYELAAQAAPPVAPARQELMFALLEICAWERAAREAEVLRAQCAEKAAGWMRAIAPLTAIYLQLDDTACRQVAAFHAGEAARGAVPVESAAPTGGQARLRIGYLSPDFREHPVGHLISAALPLHDRGRFEIFAYSCGHDDQSACRQHISETADRFVDVAAMSDAEAAAAIAGDGVQILIDLAGHTNGGRLGILARRPAPLQAHYLGYAGTTGASYIDYFITDRIATPAPFAAAFSEAIAWVPRCFMLSGGAAAPLAVQPERAAHDLPAEAMVFAAFTNASRITREVFALWMEILRAVPHSVLWLKKAQATTAHNLRTEAQRCGVDAARLVFAQRVPGRSEHLARLALADLALDTIGWHNGHSTTNDMLWAGVPVLTMPDRGFASRVGASLVGAAGQPELIARDAREYVDIAVRTGNDRARSAALKQQLAANRSTALFFDPRRIVAGLEAVYGEMWRKCRAGQPPSPIDLS